MPRCGRACRLAPGQVGAAGLRIRTPRHRQPLRHGRAAHRLAACGRDGAPHQAGLRRRACATWSKIVTQRPSGSTWCKTTSTPTPLVRSMRPSLQRRPALSWTVWSSTTPPNMAVGENLAEIEISIVERGCLSRSVPDTATLSNECRLWRPSATHTMPPLSGSSPHTRPASNSRNSTQWSSGTVADAGWRALTNGRCAAYNSCQNARERVATDE